MSKPAGKCVFCGGPGLTKSHVWPEWAEAILPESVTHHEQIIGEFHTFTPKVHGPAYYKKVKPGHVGQRKPRNTCKKCNGGWMRLIEEATMPFMAPLLLGQQYTLDATEQTALATLLCLVSMRVEMSSHEMQAIPKKDHEWLMAKPEPPARWKIWIARYIGSQRMDQRFTAMQIASSPDVTPGVEHCNTQVTSLAIGRFYAHLFSSTVWDDFSGYEGVNLVRLWPISQSVTEISFLPPIFETEVPWLHESVARTTKPVPG
jgi:hypothetical protein